MSQVYDPFIDGDCIWWERGGVPDQFYVRVHGYYLLCPGADPVMGWFTFEQIYLEWKDVASGPYRLAQSENWSGVDFTDPEVMKKHPCYGLPEGVEEELPVPEIPWTDVVVVSTEEFLAIEAKRSALAEREAAFYELDDDELPDDLSYEEQYFGNEKG